MKAIAKEVGASLSSVSRWVRDVELTREQQATLELQAFNGHVKGRAVNSAVRGAHACSLKRKDASSPNVARHFM